MKSSKDPSHIKAAPPPRADLATCPPYQECKKRGGGKKKRAEQLNLAQTAAHFKDGNLLSKVIIDGKKPQYTAGQRRRAEERKHSGLTIRRLHRCEVRRFV